MATSLVNETAIATQHLLEAWPGCQAGLGIQKWTEKSGRRNMDHSGPLGPTSRDWRSKTTGAEIPSWPRR